MDGDEWWEGVMGGRKGGNHRRATELNTTFNITGRNTRVRSGPWIAPTRRSVYYRVVVFFPAPNAHILYVHVGYR